jgi:hypothetical protein
LLAKLASAVPDFSAIDLALATAMFGRRNQRHATIPRPSGRFFMDRIATYPLLLAAAILALAACARGANRCRVIAGLLVKDGRFA